MCDYKETKQMRSMRVSETENCRKFREHKIVSKKVYNRKKMRKIDD